MVQAVRMVPDDATTHSNLGIALQAKGDIDGAVREFVEAARLEPDSAERHVNCRQARRQRMAKLPAAERDAELQAAIRDYSQAHRSTVERRLETARAKLP